ncbi:uncharacterized protein LOC103313261 isoform X1 [Tribolium castaneum]|uniref:uncharacterized protein LOC103313261 isoform X1 n=1 Tax=Tribolium castaneum TaxID=7070 RepID=UPI00077DD5B7|nr:PREDICTED: uncharacterized protein LOC103313261 isoform X1 [Tribolium castaneum]|eukprot:XP_015833816.1 PREDICTED: uncharacterized protein LOC103313261 isoform X1 [Tribolium castaneum]
MTDKAVSTEDLCIDLPRNASLEAARLEAVIKTLIENKVETLKNAKRKSSSITSSPKSLFNKLRGNSTSTVSSKDKDDITSIHSQKRHEKSGHRKASPSSPRPKAGRSLQFSDEDGNENFGFLHRDQPPGARCYCRNNPNEICSQIHVDDDFISLNIDDYENLDPEEVAAIRTVKRAQRKKRRRRKHHRKQMKMTAVAVQVNDFKDLDDDELSQRARMTIVLTAFLLLFMCLLLVGITLRMAPLIDDMVRKENEELMNSFDDPNHLQNLTVPVALK